MKTVKNLLRHPLLWFCVVLGGLSLVTLVTPIPLVRMTEIAIYAMYAMGVSLLIGYTGLTPFGASVFFGCASYAVGLGMRHLFGNEVAALLFAIVFSAVLAALLGVVILRRRGLYFSLLTLACSQIAYEIAFRWTDFTGGENGLQNVPRPWLASPWMFHLFTLVTVALIVAALWRFVHSPFGRTMQALRDNEQRVESLGYSPLRLKMVAFVVAGAVIGYAGGLLAFLLQGVYANNLSWQHAGDALMMSVLGGVHHFLGPLWGAISFVVLQDQLSALTDNWWLIFAPIIILMALLSPDGLHGFGQRLRGRQRWTLVRQGIPERPAQIAPLHDTPPAYVAGEPVLRLRQVSKRFGSIVTARNIDLDVMPRQLHSLIGPNGAGKTTLFNMLTGAVRNDTGTISLEGRDISRMPIFQRARLGLSRSFQILSVFKELTAFENVRVAVQARSPKQHWLWRDAYAIEEINGRTWSLLQAVGLVERAAERCANLSHGEQRLLEIAVTLAGGAKVLLLDEPLAGLAEADRVVVSKLIRSLADTHAILLIEHDIDRVIALSDRLTVLHQGALIADGEPAEVARHPEVIAAYMGHAHGEPQSVVPVATGSNGANRTHKPLLQVEDLCAGYDGSRILDRVNLTVGEGEVVALLGRNGVGKTTTLRALMGVAERSAGQIMLGGRAITHVPTHEIHRRGISMVPEGRRLFPNLTVRENLQLAARPGGMSVREVEALFPKLGLLRQSKAESLSGGERQMVAIARALMVPSRVILLDEPFEGLAPAVVQDIMAALQTLRQRASLVIVEHNAEAVLPLCDRAYVMVNGCVAYEGAAQALAQDHELQARLLGVVA